MHQAEHAADAGEGYVESDVPPLGRIAIGIKAQRPGRKCQSQYPGDDHHTSEQAARLRVVHEFSSPQPHGHAHDAQQGQQTRNVEAEHVRGGGNAGRQQQRVDQHVGVKQGNLPTKGSGLRLNQFWVIRDSKKLQ
ncbi:hypothetical protein D9M68_854840 [compost metagenome]